MKRCRSFEDFGCRSFGAAGFLWLWSCAPEAPIARTESSDGGAVAPGTQVLADSIADFSETQGYRGWHYGFVDPVTSPTFVPMAKLGTVHQFQFPAGSIGPAWVVEVGTYWTQLFSLGGHPNGIATSQGRAERLHFTVRRWISSVQGDVRISGQIAKIDPFQVSNGIDARIEVNGVTVYSVYVNGTDSGGVVYDIHTSVEIGSTVDFVIDPHAADDNSDLTRFTAVIAR